MKLKKLYEVEGQMSAYNACACVPSFSKGGAGVVCDITRNINSSD